MEQMAAMASLVLDGALERHPIAAGRLPRVGHRLAALLAASARRAHRVDGRDRARRLSLSATEYFARQCVISSEAEDALRASVIGAVGADHVMWASDFPHPDAVFPDSARAFVANLDAHGASDADIDAVLWSTPLDFYRLARPHPRRHDRDDSSSTRWASSPTRWPATCATRIPISAVKRARVAGRAERADGLRPRRSV